MVMKNRSRTSSEFLPVSLRFPPLAKGGLGGVVPAEPGQVRGFGSAGPAEIRRTPRLVVMPCSPPLTPPSQGGETGRSLAPAFDRATESRVSKPSRERV